VSHSAPLTPTGSTPYLSRLRPNTTHASLGYLNIIRTSAAAQLDNPSRTTDSAHARRTARACDAVLGGIFVNRLRFRRLQVAVGRENPSYPTQARTHVGRAFVECLGQPWILLQLHDNGWSSASAPVNVVHSCSAGETRSADHPVNVVHACSGAHLPGVVHTCTAAHPSLGTAARPSLGTAGCLSLGSAGCPLGAEVALAVGLLVE